MPFLQTQRDTLLKYPTWERVYIYFEHCRGPFFVFQDTSRISSLMLESSNECVALRYAICALSISSSPECTAWHMANAELDEPVSSQGQFMYEAAKRAMGLHELYQSSHSPSLRVLQVTVLLGLYELRCSRFCQAWSTVSRAVWIADSLKLHFLDTSPPFSQFPDENIDDVHAALWATTALTGFFSLSGRMIGTTAGSEISSKMPLPTQDFHVSGFADLSPLTMAHLFSRKAPRRLTVHEAMCACGVILPRIMSHIRATYEDTILPPYNFWTNHQKIHGAIGYITTLAQDAIEIEPVIDVLLNAFSIVLHDAARRRRHELTVQNFKSAWSAEERAVQHACHISKIVQVRTLSQDCWATITGSWALYVALRSLLQRQQRIALGETYPVAHFQQNSDLSVYHNDFISVGDPIITPTTVGGNFESFGDSPSLLADALVLDSINSLRLALAERSNFCPLTTFFLSQVDVETSYLTENMYSDILGCIDFTASSPMS
ncbi:hypothetical protein F5B22DRAFT_390931 [Xylaria bambusicola]|uniref:uncharacterized protein n=1 Tax=Xylaria bambusicola TaxID=326684 RepID=UPI0020084567|nr:uncharacterized protein F5B22DRAFT_390931 [Xylaria bambusicola]KAI0508536.1 hypothetical protein F5B22DRAFT_390931 [Xylaria bambusicola]